MLWISEVIVDYRLLCVTCDVADHAVQTDSFFPPKHSLLARSRHSGLLRISLEQAHWTWILFIFMDSYLHLHVESISTNYESKRLGSMHLNGGFLTFQRFVGAISSLNRAGMVSSRKMFKRRLFNIPVFRWNAF